MAVRGWAGSFVKIAKADAEKSRTKRRMEALPSSGQAGGTKRYRETRGGKKSVVWGRGSGMFGMLLTILHFAAARQRPRGD